MWEIFSANPGGLIVNCGGKAVNKPERGWNSYLSIGPKLKTVLTFGDFHNFLLQRRTLKYGWLFRNSIASKAGH